MKLQTTLRNESTSDKSTMKYHTSNSRQLADQQIARLSGALVQANPFVARPLEDFLPQRRRTVCKANKTPGSRAPQRRVDEELLHISGYFLEFASTQETPKENLSVTMPVAPIVVANRAGRSNGTFAAMTAVFGAVAMTLLAVLQLFAPASAAEVAGRASTHGAVR